MIDRLSARYVVSENIYVKADTHVYISLNLREWFDVKFSLNYTPNYFKIEGIHKSLVGPHLSTCTASHCCRLVTTRPSLQMFH